MRHPEGTLVYETPNKLWLWLQMAVCRYSSSLKSTISIMESKQIKCAVKIKPCWYRKSFMCDLRQGLHSAQGGKSALFLVKVFKVNNLPQTTTMASFSTTPDKVARQGHPLILMHYLITDLPHLKTLSLWQASLFEGRKKSDYKDI